MSSNTKEVHSSECIQTVQLKKASLPLVYTKRVQQKLKRSLTLHGTRLSMRKTREKSVFSSRKLKLVLQWEFHSICLLTITVRAVVCLNFTWRHYLSYMSLFQLSLTDSLLPRSTERFAQHPRPSDPFLSQRLSLVCGNSGHAILLVSHL